MTVKKFLLLNHIGPLSAFHICDSFGIPPLLPLADLTPNKKDQLDLLISKKISPKDVSKSSILRLISIGSWRGFNHKNRFPVRGQRTRSNAYTAKKAPHFSLIT